MVAFEPGHVTADGVALALLDEAVVSEEVDVVVELAEGVAEEPTELGDTEPVGAADAVPLIELMKVLVLKVGDCVADEEDELLEKSLAPQTPLVTADPTDDLR